MDHGIVVHPYPEAIILFTFWVRLVVFSLPVGELHFQGLLLGDLHVKEPEGGYGDKGEKD